MESGTIDHVAEVCNESKKRFPKLQLFLTDCQYLILDLVTHILNANIDQMVKQYRQEKLIELTMSLSERDLPLSVNRQQYNYINHTCFIYLPHTLIIL